MADPLRIGEAARRSGFTVKALRYYDLHGLLPPAARSAGGYRLYDAADLHRLEFIRQAKALGLALGEIRPLIDAARTNDSATRPRLKRVLDAHIEHITRQIATLTRLRRELERRRRGLHRAGSREAGYCACLGQAGSGASAPRLRVQHGVGARPKARAD
jgi:DNA-binding transcriptional MerR regulator